MKYPAKFLKPESKPEPDIEAGYPAGSGFSRISEYWCLILRNDVLIILRNKKKPLGVDTLGLASKCQIPILHVRYF